KLCKADVVGRHPKSRAAKQPLGFVDRFPPLLEWGEVPATAPRADYPQPTFLWIERQASTDGKRRKEVIGAEVRGAKEAGGIHVTSTRTATACDCVRLRSGWIKTRDRST